MTSPQLVVSLTSIVLAVTIFILVRRDRLSPRVAGKWFIVSLCVLILGIFPESIDKIGWAIGIAYPPMLALAIMSVMVIVKLLIIDIETQKQRTKLERTIQKMAMLEADLNKYRAWSKSEAD